MKKLILLVLVLALGAAFVMKPGDPKKSFSDFLAQKLTQNDSNVVAEKWSEAQARLYAETCTYHVHTFWVSALNKHGVTVYRNVFGHWFNREEVKKDVETVKEKAQVEVKQLEKSATNLQDKVSK